MVGFNFVLFDHPHRRRSWRADFLACIVLTLELKLEHACSSMRSMPIAISSTLMIPSQS